MTKKANIIELNGKRYDARTGELLHTKPTAAAKPLAPRRSLDGFVAGSIKPAHAHAAKPKPGTKPAAHHITPKVTAAKPTMVGRSARDTARPTSPYAKRRRQEHPTTLMRHTVKKPSASLKRHTKVLTNTGVLVKTPQYTIVPKYSFHAIDNKRLQHAKHVPKSKLINRFGVVEPVGPAAKRPTPVIATAQKQFATAPAKPAVTKPAAVTQAVRPIVTNRAARPSLDIFEQALAHANSHKQPALAKKHAAKKTKARRARHITNAAAAALAVVLISGFIAYQNTANIQLRLASSKAGFSAHMPDWRPSGFAVGKFTYSPGTVAINFHSNSDDRAFDLTQTTSNWDSQTLLNDFVATTSKSYDTVESAGRTIYTYGNNNATWVNGGVWYQLTSNGSLSTSQLVKLATSI